VVSGGTTILATVATVSYVFAVCAGPGFWQAAKTRSGRKTMDFILGSFRRYYWKNYARPTGNLIPAAATSCTSSIPIPGTPPAYLPRYRKLLPELVNVQRQELSRMRRDNEYSEELLRNKETELGLEEAHFRR
jgi:hypothetical protein